MNFKELKKYYRGYWKNMFDFDIKRSILDYKLLKKSNDEKVKQFAKEHQAVVKKILKFKEKWAELYGEKCSCCDNHSIDIIDGFCPKCRKTLNENINIKP